MLASGIDEIKVTENYIKSLAHEISSQEEKVVSNI